jgi:hypothetical protein
MKFLCRDEVTVITANIPDSITTWELTAFSINKHGLALTEQPIALTVSQNFFVSVNLPYSAVRGQKLDISVSVHNYFKADTHVKVTLHNNNNDFEILGHGNVQNVLSDQSVVSTCFTIVPHRVGQIAIEVTASSSEHDCDTVHRVLLVKPEGVQVKQQKQFTLAVDNNQKSFEYDLNIPENIIHGSLSNALSVKGDTSSLVLNNLEQFLIPIDYNDSRSMILVNTRSNQLLLNYLQSTRQASETVAELLKETRKAFKLNKRLQCWDGGFGDNKHCHKKQYKSHHSHHKSHSHERHTRSAMSHQRHDHYSKYYQHHSSEEHKHCVDQCSFCCKNNFNSCRSKKYGIKPVSNTFLTILASFSFYYHGLNNNFTASDKKFVDRTIKFLSQVQSCDGSFVEFDSIFSPELDNTLVNTVAFLVSLKFLERSNLLINDYNCTLNKGLEYLSNEFEKTDDPAIINRIALVFLLTDHPKRNIAKQRLELTKSKYQGALVWSNPLTGIVDNIATSFGLFINSIYGDIPNSQRIGKNLAIDSQTNLKGTIPILSSFNVLPLLANAVIPVDPNISISLTSNQKCGQFVKLTKKNQYLVQKLNLPDFIKNFKVSANGIGLANFLLSSQYNLPTSALSKQFTLALNLLPTYAKGWTLQICISFKPMDDVTQSKTATVEIDIPVGCSFSDNILTVNSSKIKVNRDFSSVDKFGLDFEFLSF